MKTMKYVLSASVMTFMLASCSEKIEEENVNASQPDAGKIEMTCACVRILCSLSLCRGQFNVG